MPKNKPSEVRQIQIVYAEAAIDRLLAEQKECYKRKLTMAAFLIGEEIEKIKKRITIIKNAIKTN